MAIYKYHGFVAVIALLVYVGETSDPVCSFQAMQFKIP